MLPRLPRSICCKRSLQSSLRYGRPIRATHLAGGVNLEIFKFGLYIMFPIGWMYYFGTNLDQKFNVPDFWPKKEETHRIPFEREEQLKLLEQMKEQRKRKKEFRRRMEIAEARARGEDVPDEEGLDGEVEAVVEKGRGLNRSFGRGAIEMWARGRS